MAIADFASNETAPDVRTHLNEVVARVNALSNGVASIADADLDTLVQAEASADEDTLRFTLAGVEMLTLTSNTAAWGATSNQTFSMTGRLLLRQVSNSNLNSNIAGSCGEVVFNSNNNSLYYCYQTGIAGSAAWWKIATN